MKSIKEELNYLAIKNGGFLSPHEVVKYARNPKTLLHKKFEWDDGKAAYQYRLEQARRTIRLELDVIETPVGDFKTRLFFSLRDDRTSDGGYRTLKAITEDESLYNSLLEEALYELGRIKQKYHTLKELKEVFSAIDSVRAESVP